MRLHRPTALLVIGLLVTALLGLGIIQVFLLRQAVSLRSEAFARNVNGALVSLVEKLETRETIDRALRMTASFPGGTGNLNGIFSLKLDDSARVSTRTLIFRHDPDTPEVALEDSTVIYRLPEPQAVRLTALDGRGREQTVLFDSRSGPGDHRLRLSRFSLEGARALRLEFETATYVILLGAMPEPVGPAVLASDADRRILIDRILEQFFRPGPRPLHERLRYPDLDSLTAATLREYGLPAECQWGIIQVETDSLLYARPEGSGEALRHTPYRTRLFPHDPIPGPDDFLLHVPHRFWILARGIGPSAVATLLFILLIAGCFIAIFRVYRAQHRFSSHLVEFVNNMTHEFKTPLTTISLAGEALSEPDVRSSPQQSLRYIGMVRDETARMHRQVEKILEMAVLERGDCDLNRELIDLHELVRTAVESFTLRVEQAGGSITAALGAEEHFIEADRIHLESVLDNLLDNAVTYTRGAPVIRLTTESENHIITLGVHDNGIGLTPEQGRHVFDAYYRVSTGDVHDVKGFGLGLSYVKLMVEAHGGTVSLRNNPGKGSSFELSLPTVPAGKQHRSPERRRDPGR